MTSTQDRIEMLTLARDMLNDTITSTRENVAQLANIAVLSDGGYLNLDRTYELIDNMTATKDRLQEKINILNDRIENEAEPDTEPDEEPATKTFKLNWSHFNLNRLLAHISFPEPPLNGGQIVNRIMATEEAHQLPAYTHVVDENDEEHYEPINHVEIIDGKLVIF